MNSIEFYYVRENVSLPEQLIQPAWKAVETQGECCLFGKHCWKPASAGGWLLGTVSEAQLHSRNPCVPSVPAPANLLPSAVVLLLPASPHHCSP